MSNNPVIDLPSIAHLSYEKRFAIEIVEELKQATGKNAKIEILKKAAANPGFVHGISLCYNPRINFYIRKIPEYTPCAQTAYHLERILDMLKDLYQRAVTGNRAIQQLKNILEWADPKDAKFIELIISRDLDCGVSTGIINKVIPGLIPVYEVMLCASFDKTLVDNFRYPAYVQTKMDGMRSNLHYNRKTGAVELFLRSGECIEVVPPQLVDDVANQIATKSPFNQISFVLDGELLVVDDNGKFLSRKTGNGILTKLVRGTISEDEISKIRFVTWDFVELDAFWKGEWNVSYQSRYTALTEALRDQGIKSIIPILSASVHSSLEAEIFYKDQLAAGREGSILKEANAPWAAGRQKWQVKMKVADPITVRITGIYEGEGKYAGKLGGFTYESLDGTIVGNVGSGFSDKQREEFFLEPPIGKLADLEYNEVIESKGSDKKNLYLPVFIEIRIDLAKPD